MAPSSVYGAPVAEPCPLCHSRVPMSGVVSLCPLSCVPRALVTCSFPRKPVHPVPPRQAWDLVLAGSPSTPSPCHLDRGPGRRGHDRRGTPPSPELLTRRKWNKTAAGGRGGIIVKTAQPGRGGLLGPGRKRAGLRPAKLDVASMSHRQRGAWAGGSRARAAQLGSVSVQAGARTVRGGQSLSQRSGRLAGRGGHT